MSKKDIQRVFDDLGIGNEAERRRYLELARMDEEDSLVGAPPSPDPRQWLRWDNTCGPAADEEY